MRNQEGLSQHQITRCLFMWEVLGGIEWCGLETTEAAEHGSRTRFSETHNVVFLGADVEPGVGVEARFRMSPLACLAHELAHARRFSNGYNRSVQMPDKLIDEAEASIDASFLSVLSATDRHDLIEDAHNQLSRWLSETSEENE